MDDFFVLTATMCMLSLKKKVVKIIVCHNWRLFVFLFKFAFQNTPKLLEWNVFLIPNANLFLQGYGVFVFDHLTL